MDKMTVPQVLALIQTLTDMGLPTRDALKVALTALNQTRERFYEVGQR